MAAKESKRKEKARLITEVVEAVAQAQVASSAAAGRLHGAEGAAGGRRALLHQLEQQPGLTVPELARLRGVSRQYVQTVVNDLVSGGLVEAQPNPGHKRSPRLQATKAGTALLEDSARREGPFAETLAARSEEHTSELQSLMRISYAVFCLKKK